MRKHLGILGILLAVGVTASLFGDNFLTGYNLQNLTQRTALFSILALGAGLVIATGGMAIPQLGATDFGLKIARQFGLKGVEPRPALVGAIMLVLGAIGAAAIGRWGGAASVLAAGAGPTFRPLFVYSPAVRRPL